MRRSIGVFAAVLLLLTFAAGASADEPFKTDVFVSGREGYPVYRIPAMVVTNQGAVLAFCEGRKTGIADHGNLDIVLKRSFDNGRTWGELQVIQKSGFVTWGNPAPVADRRTGRVWLPFCLNNDRVFVTYSDDDGASWAEPREITSAVKKPGWGWYATGPGHSIQLASGRLLVPCDHYTKFGIYSHVIYSDDGGETWELGGVLDEGTNESMAVQTVAGKIYLTMRNNYPEDLRAYAWSNDGGESFSKVKLAEDLVGPTCQASILRYTSEAERDGDRILFLNPAGTKRRNMAVRVSRDEAKSWGQPRTLHEGPAAYSDMAVLPNGNAGALYENGKLWPYSRITFAEMDIEWIEGRDNSPEN